MPCRRRIRSRRSSSISGRVRAPSTCRSRSRRASASRPAPAGAPAKVPDNRPPPAIGPGDGAESIDAVVKTLQTAMTSGKAAAALSVIHPHDRPQFAQGIAMVVTFSTLANMSDAKASEKAQKDVDALFARHKVEPPFNRDPGEIFKSTNLAAFLTDAMALLKGQTKKGEDAASVLPIPKGRPQNVKMTGDSAVAQLEGRDVTFTRVGGRWFIRLE